MGEALARTVGGVPVDDRRVRISGDMVILCVFFHVGAFVSWRRLVEQLGQKLTVALVGRACSRGDDDLCVGIDRDVPL